MIKNRPRSKQFVSVSKMRCLDEYDDGLKQIRPTVLSGFYGKTMEGRVKFLCRYVEFLLCNTQMDKSKMSKAQSK